MYASSMMPAFSGKPHLHPSLLALSQVKKWKGWHSLKVLATNGGIKLFLKHWISIIVDILGGKRYMI